MTAFAYTSGNPNNLVANQNASMADIQGPLTDLRTFLNGGTMDETNVPNLAAAFTTYKQMFRGGGTHVGASTTTFLLAFNANSSFNQNGVTPGVGTATTIDFMLYLDPTSFAANSRTTKLRIRAMAVPNATAPAINYAVGLYPVATYGGAAAGGTPFINTLGTLVAGSAATITTPAASGLTTAAGADFNFPAAGAYVLAVVPSGASSANNVTQITANLEMRQV